MESSLKTISKVICAVLEAAKVVIAVSPHWKQEVCKEVDMEVFNGTPHDINILVNGVVNTEIRKLVVPSGATPEIIKSIPSSGMLSAKIETVQIESINGIPVFAKKVTGCDPIPESDVVIVSALYVSAARAMGLDTARLYTVADPVYSQDGRTILGCRGICPAF